MKDRSLKDEMREALRGDRERAEARRKAAEEGAYVGPAPPTLDLNRPTREWKLPQKGEEPEVEPEPEPATEEEEALEPATPELEPAAEIEPEPEVAPEPDVEPAPEPRWLLARLRAFFGG